MTDAIQKEIEAKGLTAPRVTPADIEANINEEHYFTAENGVTGARQERSVIDLMTYGSSTAVIGCSDLSESLSMLTFCVLVLRNGFTVTGESACASPENFNAEIGRTIARQNAVNKVWSLMGYELRTKLSTVETN